jgi:hypothetical protein
MALLLSCWPCCWLTLVVFSNGAALPNGVVPKGGDDPVDPWRELDHALARLGVAEGEGPFSYGALVRAFYTHSPTEASAGTDDISGTVLEDADVFFSYHEGDVGWRVSADLDEGEPELEDAFAQWQYDPACVLSMGQFKPRVVRSGSLPADGLLYRERTFLGAAFDLWDDGVELGGHYDQFDYWLAVTDGSNASESTHFWSARTEWALWDAAFEDREGARGSPNHLRTLLGAFTFSDAAQSNSDGDGYGLDLALTFGPYAFHAEWADIDEAFARTIDVFNGYLVTLGDGQPRSATLSRRVGDFGEAALRFQNADDVDSTEEWALSANWSPGGGPARLVADLGLVEGDTRDFSIFSLGIQLGSSGLSRPFAGGGTR